jgi:hypothetical protein
MRDASLGELIFAAQSEDTEQRSENSCSKFHSFLVKFGI